MDVPPVAAVGPAPTGTIPDPPKADKGSVFGSGGAREGGLAYASPG